METWNPSHDWLERHDSADLVYRVRLRFAEASLADATWQELDSALTRDPHGDLLAGGVALSRAGARSVDVTSGGEDALDSLTDGVEQVVHAAARHQAAPVVVAEERSVWLPEESHLMP